MTDIVERLRGYSTLHDYDGISLEIMTATELIDEAAEEIERLRAALEKIANLDQVYECWEVARAALTGPRRGGVMESPNLTWFEPTENKCSRCGKRATGILRGYGNESYGPHCERCANKRIADSEKVRAAHREGE